MPQFSSSISPLASVPYAGETAKNYVMVDFESDMAEIVLLDMSLLPQCFEAIVKRFLVSKTEKH